MNLEKDRFYMHPVSGFVQTGDDWEADRENDDPEAWKDAWLIEVEKVDGEWEEV